MAKHRFFPVGCLFRFLPTSSSACLRCLFPITPHHDQTQERADDGRGEEGEDDGDTNGPDTGREKGLQRMCFVDERLENKSTQSMCIRQRFGVERLAIGMRLEVV